MSFLYNFFIQLYYGAVRIASLKNTKAKKWLTGRRNIFDIIGKKIPGDEKVVWIHSASLGEFEQGRPIIEQLRKQYPRYKILLTFFSPSGYEVRKNYEDADYIFYLPIDTPGNANRFVNMVNPELVVFIKYEFWFNYIKTLNRRDIPIVIVSAFFRPGQHFFKWYGGWFRSQLKKIPWFFVQNNESKNLLQKIGITSVSVSGDTRFDRVMKVTEDAGRFPLIEEFAGDSAIFMAGSSWPPEEQIVNGLIKKGLPGMKFIIAPHDISKSHIEQIEELIKIPTIRYSGAQEKNISEFKVLIIDSIGILNQLYKYAGYAMIGGGFGPGIHNILEAAAFGMPVFFGPNYKRFREAVELINLKSAFEIITSDQLIQKVMEFERNPDYYEGVANENKHYVKSNTGATSIVLNKIKTFLTV